MQHDQQSHQHPADPVDISNERARETPGHRDTIDLTTGHDVTEDTEMLERDKSASVDASQTGSSTTGRPASPLLFRDLKDTEAFLEPRSLLQPFGDLDNPDLTDDVDELVNAETTYVQRLRSAFDGETSIISCSWNGSVFGEGIVLPWREWQTTHWDRIRRLDNGSTETSKMVESRLCPAYKEVIAGHRNGHFEGISADQGLTCSERLEAVRGVIRDSAAGETSSHSR